MPLVDDLGEGDAHGQGDIRIAVQLRFKIVGHDLRKNQGIGQTMGDVVNPAECMRYAVHHPHHGVGKRNPCKEAAHLHGAARLQVVRLGAGLQYILGY